MVPLQMWQLTAPYTHQLLEFSIQNKCFLRIVGTLPKPRKVNCISISILLQIWVVCVCVWTCYHKWPMFIRNQINPAWFFYKTKSTQHDEREREEEKSGEKEGGRCSPHKLKYVFSSSQSFFLPPLKPTHTHKRLCQSQCRTEAAGLPHLLSPNLPFFISLHCPCALERSVGSLISTQRTSARQ